MISPTLMFNAAAWTGALYIAFRLLWKTSEFKMDSLLPEDLRWQYQFWREKFRRLLGE